MFHPLYSHLRHKWEKTYAQGSGGVFSATSGTSWGPKISELPNDATYGGNTDNEYTQKFGKQQGKYYVPQRAAAGLDPWATPQAYDNAKDFFDTGITWSNSLNVAQMLEKSSYSISLGNTHQDGIISSLSLIHISTKGWRKQLTGSSCLQDKDADTVS